MRPARRLLVLTLAAGLGLAACSSPEERAQTHYERAVAYLAEGDTARAGVEFRNVFRLDDDHEAARLAYADMLRAAGDAKAALAQYQLAARQHSGSLPAQRATAELALDLQDLETATQAADRAFALSPAEPDLRALKASIDYRRGRDRPAAVGMARAVVAEAPGNVRARIVLVADRLAAKDLAGARAEVETGLAAAPAAEELHVTRVALLEEAGDTAALGLELARMVELYPDDEAPRAALVRWHLAGGDTAGAEAVLRAAADVPGAAPGAALTLARFLLETTGAAAARDELAARTDAAGGAGAEAARPYARALAGLDYAQGDRAGGIGAIRALLDATPASDAGRDLKIDLARMLLDAPAPDAPEETRGERRAESARLVAEVLAEDTTHMGALKLGARAAIDGDRAEAAIRHMRTALIAAPRDPEVMTLMALAHERLGQRALMGEQLALAVEASNRGRDESLRYASFLMQEDRPAPAEGVALGALRRAPEDAELLETLGRIRLAKADWSGAARAAALLRRTGDPAAAAVADALDAARLEGEGRTGESLARLEMLAGPAGAGQGGASLAALVRARVAAGETDAAEASLDARLEADPDDADARYLKAGLAALGGRPAEAEGLYREVIAADPARPEPYQALFALLAAQGRASDADAALEAGIAATGAANGPLLFARAGVREATGDIAGAVADYETLYARSSADPVLANNLASLLLATPDGSAPDPATLDRAWAIARRLQESGVPEFQDTLGWILHLKGDDAGALALLDAAADALPGNAGVQFRAGEAARALGRREAAAERYADALAAAEAGSPLPEIATLRARLAETAPESDG